MLKTLCRRQWLQMTAFLTTDQRNGKRRSLGSLMLYAILFLFAFGAMIALFYNVGRLSCRPLLDAGLGWNDSHPFRIDHQYFHHLFRHL